MTKAAVIKVTVNAEYVGKLIKTGLKTNDSIYSDTLTGAKLNTAIAFDANLLVEKIAEKIAKAPNDNAKSALLYSLFENAKGLNFKTRYKPEAAAPAKATAAAPKAKKTAAPAATADDEAPKKRGRKPKAAVAEVETVEVPRKKKVLNVAPILKKKPGLLVKKLKLKKA